MEPEPSSASAWRPETLRTHLLRAGAFVAIATVLVLLFMLVRPLRDLSDLSWSSAVLTWAFVSIFVTAVQLEQWRTGRSPRVRR